MRRSKRSRNKAQNPDYLYLSHPDEGTEEAWHLHKSGHTTMPAKQPAAFYKAQPQTSRSSPIPRIPDGFPGVYTSFALELGLHPSCKRRRSVCSAVLGEAAVPYHSPDLTLKSAASDISALAQSHTRVLDGTSSPQPQPAHAELARPLHSTLQHRSDSGSMEGLSDMSHGMSHPMAASQMHQPKGARPAGTKGSDFRKARKGSAAAVPAPHRRKGKPVRSTY